MHSPTSALSDRISGPGVTTVATTSMTADLTGPMSPRDPAGPVVSGSGHYDWATPGLVRLNVIDSNAFGHRSYWEYHVDEVEDGSRVTLTVHRHPSTAKGRLLDAVLAIAGRWVFGADLRRALRRLEGCASSGSP